MSEDQQFPSARRVRHRLLLAEGVAFALAAAVVSWSAVMAKEASVRGTSPEAMLQTAHVGGNVVASAVSAVRTPAAQRRGAAAAPAQTVAEAPAAGSGSTEPQPTTQRVWPPDTRWFDGRPVRPARTMVLRTTGYSPTEACCAPFNDGQTASLHSVWTNGMALVAADTRLLPFGTLVSIPGYDGDRIVPVLDRGGKIKGRRLDLLFPTRSQARRWGVQNLAVTVWEYADGKPATDPRKVR